jgi:hypothetical protein
MRYERVKVKRDTNTVHNVLVRPWEVPVLEYVFEEGNVEFTDEFETVSQDYPDPAKELQRLEKCYGSDPKSGIPYAISVFGDGRKGLRELAKMIAESKAEDDKAAKAAPVKATVKPRRRRIADEAVDSLLS